METCVEKKEPLPRGHVIRAEVLRCSQDHGPMYTTLMPSEKPHQQRLPTSHQPKTITPSTKFKTTLPIHSQRFLALFIKCSGLRNLICANLPKSEYPTQAAFHAARSCQVGLPRPCPAGLTRSIHQATNLRLRQKGCQGQLTDQRAKPSLPIHPQRPRILIHSS